MEIGGGVLAMGAETIASYDGDSGIWTGELIVDDERSDRIDVRFVGHDGTAIQPASEFYLEVDIADESMAEFEQNPPGAFSGHLLVHDTGHTEMVLSLMQGGAGSGHADYVTAELAVHTHSHR